jgi:hypothetical protein
MQKRWTEKDRNLSPLDCLVRLRALGLQEVLVLCKLLVNCTILSCIDGRLTVDSSCRALRLANIAVNAGPHSLYIVGDVFLRKRADPSEIVWCGAVGCAGSHECAVCRCQASLCAACRHLELPGDQACRKTPNSRDSGSNDSKVGNGLHVGDVMSVEMVDEWVVR